MERKLLLLLQQNNHFACVASPTSGLSQKIYSHWKVKKWRGDSPIDKEKAHIFVVPDIGMQEVEWPKEVDIVFSDMLNGVDEIIEYMGISRTEYYRDHAEGLRPFLLTRENAQKRRVKHRIYTYESLIRAYLLRVEGMKQGD